MRTPMSAAAFLSLLALGAAMPAFGQALSSRPAAQADVATLDGIIAAFYDVVSGPAGVARDWSRDSTLYTVGVRFAYEVGPANQRRWQSVDHATYARQAGPALERGFFEREIHRTVQRYGAMAHVMSTYEWSSPTVDGPARGRGINSIELVHEGGRWWITFAQWVEESPDRPIPAEFLPAAPG